MNKKINNFTYIQKLTGADDSITFKNGQSWKNRNYPTT